MAESAPRTLEQWCGASNFLVGPAEWRWVNEDYDTADGLPFTHWGAVKGHVQLLHRYRLQRVGISAGTAKADVGIADLRAGAVKSVGQTLRSDAPIVQEVQPGSGSKSEVKSIDDILTNEGGIIKQGKEKLAVWKSMDGTLHALSAECTYAGCTVT